MVKELLKKLISVNTIDSIGGEAVAGAIVSYLEKRRVPFELHEHVKGGVKNFIFVSGKPPFFVLNGHYDVVPAGTGWSSPPFSPIEKDGFIYGRGASDMKGGLAALAGAFANVSLKLRDAEGGGIILVVAGDEEKGGFNGTGSVAKQLCSTYNICGAIVAEPTCSKAFGDSVKPGRRGVVWFNVEVIGKGGHASAPQNAKNPLEGVAILVEHFKNVKLDDAPDMVPTTISPTMVEVDSTAQNVIPRTAKLWVDMRTNYALDVDAFLESIPKILEKEGFGCNLEVQIKVDAFMTENKDFVDALCSIVEERTGIKPKLTTAGGSSDARFFVYEGVPTVEFGPVARNIHAADEHVSISEVELLSSVVEDFVLKWLRKRRSKRDENF